jgi:hypothetical protein
VVPEQVERAFVGSVRRKYVGERDWFVIGIHDCNHVAPLRERFIEVSPRESAFSAFALREPGI